MFDELRKIPVFVVRDFRILFTYKLAFSMTFFSIVFNLFYLVLFGSMFGSADLAVLSSYGGDFISYILVGSIGWGFLWTIMGATSTSLRTEMMIGTLESILLTSTKMFTMMLSYSLFGCFFGLISIGILMLVGHFLFGITVFATATVYTLIIFILSATMMMGFGLIFGGLTIWLKNIGSTLPLLQNIIMFFCGVYFPISVLPEFMQPIANYMPFYYSIEGLRKSLIPSTPTSEVLFYVLVLLFLSILFMILGIFVLHRGLIKAKKGGSLSFY
ncbi:MAG: ABC transporter permease [Thermoplasmatales archaeon]|nr:ABC transporter permease [Thermoplasmatales archaeon]